MASTTKNFLSYRCEFRQLPDGQWMAEDWRILGLTAIARTRSECQDRIRALILADATVQLGPSAIDAALALSEYAKPGDVVEYLVTGKPYRPLAKMTNA